MCLMTHGINCTFCILPSHKRAIALLSPKFYPSGLVLSKSASHPPAPTPYSGCHCGLDASLHLFGPQNYRLRADDLYILYNRYLQLLSTPPLWTAVNYFREHHGEALDTAHLLQESNSTLTESSG